MVLHTCPMTTVGAPVHPCAKAAKALDDAGHRYELRPAGGIKALGFTRRGKRDHIRELTGQEDVPMLELDEPGAAPVVGSGAIVAWAKANPARPAAA